MAFSYLFFHIFVLFSFSPDFSSKISLQSFKIQKFKFGIQVHNDKLFRGIENGPSFCSSLYLFFFSFSPDFSSKISLQPFKIETSNLVYRFTTTSCIVELKMGLLLFVLLYICSFFSFSPEFWSKISLQPFKLETSNLVYRFTTTSCDVGLKMDILLFVLRCIFLSLYIFRQRYQPYALEALKRGYSQIF